MDRVGETQAENEGVGGAFARVAAVLVPQNVENDQIREDAERAEECVRSDNRHFFLR